MKLSGTYQSSWRSTQKGICGAVLTVQQMQSGEKYKNYDHILTSNSTNSKHISGEYFSCNYAYIICFQMEIKQMGILSKDFSILPLSASEKVACDIHRTTMRWNHKERFINKNSEKTSSAHGLAVRGTQNVTSSAIKI